MSKNKFELIIFLVNIIYMILELIASRVLSPFFGNSNIIWTSVIGVILLSTSIGNYLGGIAADKGVLNKKIKLILSLSGILIMIIPLIQANFLNMVTVMIHSLKIGAILSTVVLFFLPAMFIGMLSPIIIKIKLEDFNNAGKISGRIYAIATLGSIVGTFLGGFLLVPNFGSNEILFVLAIIMFVLMLYSDYENIFNNAKKITGLSFLGIVFCCTCFYSYSYVNIQNGTKVLEGDGNVFVSYDTQYGRVIIYNGEEDGEKCRLLTIDKGNESATYIDEDKCYDLVFEYTKYYDLMFKSSREIKNVAMIGGAGYSYPKYFISHFLDKNMDVIEIDEKITEIAKNFFFLDKLINDFNLDKNNRLNLIEEDGRVFLNKNNKKYDAILNDAFSGESPAKTLTTIEAAQKIYSSLNDKGVYLTNIISSIDGRNSKFLKAEVKTLNQVFKNVYVVPCSYKDNSEKIQNNMVIATDEELVVKDSVNIDFSEAVIITDNYCPVDSLTPRK